MCVYTVIGTIAALATYVCVLGRLFYNNYLIQVNSDDSEHHNFQINSGHLFRSRVGRHYQRIRKIFTN